MIVCVAPPVDDDVFVAFVEESVDNVVLVEPVVGAAVVSAVDGVPITAGPTPDGLSWARTRAMIVSKNNSNLLIIKKKKKKQKHKYPLNAVTTRVQKLCEEKKYTG